MIPSVVASEVTGALRDFLTTGFGPSSPELAGVVDDFLADSENLVKGPYLSVALPFRRAPEGGEPFPEAPLGFTPYRHQRTAFSRLAASAGRSTVIATGTGSGKTECFLFPILDYCREQAAAPGGRQEGIKAILIYPMNALAMDQARRIAQTIHRTPSLRGRVSAGLYVGESERTPHTAMGPDHVITDRGTLRERPPDILLTNYKMLDFLLIRPIDHRLWRHNAPDTLRYLVVDELHTFDGPQGTDLACLIRRLRSRLGVARERLICVGTSATIGGEESREELIDYVSRIFDQPFEPDAIVGEVRQGIDEFLGRSIISRSLLPRDDLATRVDHTRYATVESYVRAQHEVFFGESVDGDIHAAEWRVALAQRLREHLTFVNLLRVLEGRPKPLSEIVERLRPSLPVASDGEAAGVLNGLCALISVARRLEDDTTGPGAETGNDAWETDDARKLRPFLQVGLHLWVRELRRMVCRLGEPGADEPSRLRFSDDLKADEPSVHLPLIQCRECRVTGWGAVRRPAEQRVDQDLRVFYNRFFSRDIDVKYFFPTDDPPPGVRGIDVSLCDACGFVHAGRNMSACAGCGSDRLVPVFCPESVVTRRKRNELSRDCPYCGAREALIILGSRASSLLSVTLGQTFASRHNDDPKVIAFSDNVQDAAHRAGFFSARTWQNSVRAAVTQVVAHHDPITLAELPERVVSWWGDPGVNPGAFDAERFVSEFIAPDRQWLRGFVDLQRQGRLPAGSDVPALVERRMRWDTLAELGYRATIGRTLERTRTVAVGVDRDTFTRACEAVHVRIREEIGSLRDLPAELVRALVLGLLRRMKDRGAIRSDATERYVADGGNLWQLTRDPALQDFGRRSAVPVFPGEQAGGRGNRGIEPLAQRGQGARSWYQRWVEKVLTPFEPLAATQYSADVLEAVFRALESTGLVCRLDAGKTHAFALEPERFYATARVAVMHGRHAKIVVPEQEADLWRGVPCLDLGLQDEYRTAASEPPTWFGQLYRETAIRRIVAAEHTALIEREERDRLQERFADPAPKPWEPNVLSATPTLELGIDIGDLSNVVMCSVPPAPKNYQQRTGRAGRRDGNALTVTVATGQPHDLYFYAEPLDMLASRVDPPGVFLNASAVLERQLTAFCLDNWVADGVPEGAVPQRIRPVLDNVESARLRGFPYPFFDFVQRSSDDLLERFLAAFANDLTPASRDYLTKFLQGDAGERAPLTVRVLNRLLEVANERKAIRAEVEALRRRIGALERDPPDEARDAEIEEITRERQGLQGILRGLNARNTYEFLTDEGLIPNYAFPEKGVTLRSVIWRRRQRGAGEEGGYDQEVYEYERPAVSALSELAPENEFYAGSRHVSITRIDTRVSGIESWRLCRSCACCEKLEPRDDHTTCPRCGDPMWSDEGQRHNMLPLRLVHAVTPDQRSRIVDDKDDREPLFYTRHLVADFAPSAIRQAYALANPDLPFGFEYIESATFREMNFGRLGDATQPTVFAGRELPRGGFRICRHCGTVQRRGAESFEHTRNCSARNDESGEAIVDCLYLYREFSSEAIRMLLPISDVLGSEQRVASFIAALELGLRRRFRGSLDHIRAMTCDNALAGANEGRRYLMLYDTVPGGTGYLKDLMTDRGELPRVFGLALESLKACECNREPHKDGCYRCVYAYRRSRDMALTSRRTAVEILESILDHVQELEEVEGLDKVKVNAVLESELEARFIEALRRMRIDGERPGVRHDLVQGKPGYVLKVGDRTWFVEPQTELGESEGVAVPSRPDFLIRPARATEAPPVAVFMDGFEYHRDVTDQDSAKRMALVQAGFLVWSLTWHDLEVAFGKAAEAVDFLDGQADGGVRGSGPNTAATSEPPRTGELAELQRRLDERWDTAAIRTGLRASSLELLLRYLAAPMPEKWKQAVFTALVGLFEQRRMESGEPRMLSPELRSRFDAAVEHSLPGQVREALQELGHHEAPDDLPHRVAVAGRGVWLDSAPRFADLFLALPLSAVRNGEPDHMAAIVHLHDDEPSREHPRYRPVWNGVLRLYNLLQFLPGAWWTTRIGVERDLYPEYERTDQPPSVSGPADGWEEAMELSAPELRPAMEQWSALGLPVPEAGFELIGPSGRVIAEAELGWPEHRVAVLLPEQREWTTAFEAEGWRVMHSGSDDISGAAAEALNL